MSKIDFSKVTEPDWVIEQILREASLRQAAYEEETHSEWLSIYYRFKDEGFVHDEAAILAKQ